MKLPSFGYLNQEATKTFKRFPLVITDALFGCLSASYLIELDNNRSGHEQALYNTAKLLMVFLLGLTSFLSIKLIKERKNWPRNIELIANLAVVVILAIYYFTLPEETKLTHNSAYLIRFLLYNIGLHLLVAFAPFLDKNELNGFWEYNKTLFLRILTAVLYSTVLYAGLAVALLSIDKLLEIEISSRIYFHLNVYIFGIFNTWFFLAGIPEDFSKLEKEYYFPFGLKIFTQYILIPIVSTYLIILYLYGLKIGIKLDWPKGGVSALIIGCSFLGILSLLLIYPLQNSAEKILFKKFSNSFYIVLLPLIVMLFFAVSRRVSDYGITENRYFLYIICFWLLGISLYFVVSKSKNIKVIPISLFIIVFLISFGPWGAFSVSEESQLKRLKVLLEKNHILENEKIIKTTRKIPIEDNNEINFIISYLAEREYTDKINNWFENKLKLENSYSNQQKIVEAMGLEFVVYYNNFNNSNKYLNFSSLANTTYLYDINGFSLMYKMTFYASNLQGYKIISGKDIYKITYNQDSFLITIFFPDNSKLDFNISDLIKSLDKEFSNKMYQIPIEKMAVVKESDKYKIKIFFNTIQGNKSNNLIKINSLIGDLLIKKK